jgi:hypothetical protein
MTVTQADIIHVLLFSQREMQVMLSFSLSNLNEYLSVDTMSILFFFGMQLINMVPIFFLFVNFCKL